MTARNLPTLDRINWWLAPLGARLWKVRHRSGVVTWALLQPAYTYHWESLAGAWADLQTILDRRP